MTKFLTAAEKIAKANELIEQARSLPIPGEMGWQNFSYVAQIKDLLRKAREPLRFILLMAGVSEEVKAETQKVIAETLAVENELLHKT